jgi:hypothetical protein
MIQLIVSNRQERIGDKIYMLIIHYLHINSQLFFVEKYENVPCFMLSLLIQRATS